MCGRITITVSVYEKLIAAFPWLKQVVIAPPRYNLAPTQDLSAILDEKPDEISTVRWGLIPRWASDASIGNKLFNARAETLAEKPSFRDAYAKRRCLLIADGFYEWAAVPGQKLKQPYYIQLRTHEPFAFAGLWEKWRDPGGGEVVSSTLITTTPNELLARIHDRMPVILTGEACRRWISAGPPAAELLAPCPADLLETHPVSTLVNNARTDDPRCTLPVASEQTLF